MVDLYLYVLSTCTWVCGFSGELGRGSMRFQRRIGQGKYAVSAWKSGSVNRGPVDGISRPPCAGRVLFGVGWGTA